MNVTCKYAKTALLVAIVTFNNPFKMLLQLILNLAQDKYKFRDPKNS